MWGGEEFGFGRKGGEKKDEKLVMDLKKKILIFAGIRVFHVTDPFFGSMLCYLHTFLLVALRIIPHPRPKKKKKNKYKPLIPPLHPDPCYEFPCSLHMPLGPPHPQPAREERKQNNAPRRPNEGKGCLVY